MIYFIRSSALFILLICFSCRAVLKSPDLRMLSYKESLLINLKEIPPATDAVFVNSAGDTLNQEKLDSLFENSNFALDQLVDKNGFVRKFVVRQRNKKDEKWTNKLIEARKEQVEINSIQQEQFVNNSLTQIVSCMVLDSLLESIFNIDQGMRNGQVNYDKNLDIENQALVIRIIEQCKFPLETELSKKSNYALFLVIQHSSNHLMEKYYPRFEQAVKMGFLPKRLLALMEDRILIANGLPQKYGSQVQSISNGPHKALPLQSPDSVDIFRTQVGLEPLSEYLKRFD